MQQQKFEIYNHRILWAAAERNVALANDPNNQDAKFFALGSMFLFFAAFEGYLNWLGTRIAPEVWKEEREFFSRSPFKGTLGKYRFLATILRLPDPDPSQGPFQTATDLLKLRDMVAHPKSEAGERSVKCRKGDFPQHYQSELEKKVSADAATRARDHLKELADALHCEANEAYSGNIHESEAFGVILGTEITDA